jgi:hypothetical protein
MRLEQGADCIRWRRCSKREVLAFPRSQEVAQERKEILFRFCQGGPVNEPIDVGLDSSRLCLVGDRSWLHCCQQRSVGGWCLNTIRHASSLPCRSRRGSARYG